jgi:hypothetical protein
MTMRDCRKRRRLGKLKSLSLSVGKWLKEPEGMDEERRKARKTDFGDFRNPSSFIVSVAPSTSRKAPTPHLTPFQIFEPCEPFCGPMPFLQVMPDDFFGALENNFSNIFVSMPIYVKCRDLRPVSP